MDAVEEYPNHPLTTTRMIAWDSPATWGTSNSPHQSSTATTSQPLTVNNLSAYVEAQSSPLMDSKSDIMTRYYSSMKNNHLEALRMSPNNKHCSGNSTQLSSGTAATTTKNVAIDAHPLPFPYHNDCTFLPTVETGRTRFDSESTQSLYDSQPSSPTLSAFSSSKRHIYSTSRSGGPSPSLSPSRNIPGYQRYRRGSNISHYSTMTTATGTTTASARTENPQTNHHSILAQQRSNFKSTKKQVNALINNSRYIPSGAQRRLSMLLVKGDKATAEPIKKQHNLKGQQSILNPSSKKAIYGQQVHTSSPSISTAALYEYYQASSTSSQQHQSGTTPCYMETATSLSTSSSPSPPPSPVSSYTYTTDSDMPTVISSSTFPHESSVWQNQIVYMASPSDQYHRRHEKPTPRLPSSYRKDGFFVRVAKKIWPFRHI